MPPAARVGDNHSCPIVVPNVGPHTGGPVLPTGCLTVLIQNMPAARATDRTICTGMGIPDTILKGSSSVYIGGLPAARMGDSTSHGGSITAGCYTVIIGG